MYVEKNVRLFFHGVNINVADKIIPNNIGSSYQNIRMKDVSLIIRDIQTDRNMVRNFQET